MAYLAEHVYNSYPSGALSPFDEKWQVVRYGPTFPVVSGHEYAISARLIRYPELNSMSSLAFFNHISEGGRDCFRVAT